MTDADIEAVARAIAGHYGPLYDDCPDCHVKDGRNIPDKEGHLDAARDAITAYEALLAQRGLVVVPREPTDKMMRAGAANLRNFTTQHAPYPRTRSMFAAMIEAAITGDDAPK